MGTHVTSTELLQAAFPGRSSLSPKEVARAIYGEGKDTRKRVEQINRALNEGRLVPGLRKDGPRWRIPIASLGAAMDRRVQPVATLDSPTPTRRSRHNTIGPRMLFQRARASEVFRLILDQIQRLQALEQERSMETGTKPARGQSRRRMRL